MRAFLLATGFLAATVGGAAAQDACGELWFARNGIYKDAGYCFKTTRAIRAFGNAGCQYDNQDDVPLTARDRARIAEIVNLERARRCPR